MNISCEGNDLVIRVPLNIKGSVSKSGKSHVIGSTEGFAGASTPFGMVKIGLNVITTDTAWAGGGEGKPAVATPTLVKRA